MSNLEMMFFTALIFGRICRKHGRAELLAVLTTDDASSNTAAGRPHMTRIVTRI